MSEMTASEFCRGVKRCVEPLHIKLLIRTPRNLPSGDAAFCYIGVEAYLQNSKGKRQFATLTISPARGEITGGEMVNSHSLSLIKKVIKEHASYVKMHIDAVLGSSQDTSRILSEIW